MKLSINEEFLRSAKEKKVQGRESSSGNGGHDRTAAVCDYCKKRLYVSKVSPTILVLHAVSQPVHPTEGTDVQETLIRKYHLFLPGYDWHRSTAHCSINSLGSLLQCTVEICFFREPRINKGQLQGLLLVPLGSPYAT